MKSQVSKWKKWRDRWQFYTWWENFELVLLLFYYKTLVLVNSSSLKNIIFLIFLVYKFERRKCQMTLIPSNKIIVLYVNGFHLIKWILIRCYVIFKLFEKIYLILKSFFNFRSGHHHNYFKVELFIIRFNLIWAKKNNQTKIC